MMSKNFPLRSTSEDRFSELFSISSATPARFARLATLEPCWEGEDGVWDRRYALIYCPLR